MIDKPEIVHTTAQHTAFIHVKVPRSEIHHVMGPGIKELMATVAAQGIAPSGPWFTHHLKVTPDAFELEISVPVPTPIVAAGRVEPGQFPVAKVVRAVYQGGYEGLGSAWGEVMAWIEAEGLTPAPDFWEVYLTGPESSPDPARWRTELNRRLMD